MLLHRSVGKRVVQIYTSVVQGSSSITTSTSNIKTTTTTTTAITTDTYTADPSCQLAGRLKCLRYHDGYRGMYEWPEHPVGHSSRLGAASINESCGAFTVFQSTVESLYPGWASGGLAGSGAGAGCGGMGAVLLPPTQSRFLFMGPSQLPRQQPPACELVENCHTAHASSLQQAASHEAASCALL